MATYKTPGTYIEEINQPATGIESVSTSIPVFVGYTEKTVAANQQSILFKPIRVTSVSEYESNYGGAPPATANFCLHESVRLYFDNGGKEIYIISCGDYTEGIELRPLLRGINRSRTIDATLIAVPEAVFLTDEIDFYKLQQKMLTICADKGNRFAVLDTQRPTTNLESDLDNYRAGIGNNHLKWGACYYPWLKTVSGKTVPPSGAVCGVYVNADMTRGVWKAPANVSLNGITDITKPINEATGDDMNVSSDGKAINAIRKFPGKGILIWGARTLAGNDNEWRYVSVRRFFIMVEQSVSKGTAAFVFEPSTNSTWIKAKALIENYLFTLWKSGALMGAKPEEAYYVHCGLGSTMTAQDMQERKMIIEMGMAVVRPAEFILLRIALQMMKE